MKNAPSITMKPMMPHQVRLLGPNLCGRQVRDVVGEARLEDHVITGSGVRLSSFGQNQAVSAIAIGSSAERQAPRARRSR